MEKSEINKTIEVGETSKVDQKHRDKDHVVISIKNMFEQLRPVPGGSDQCSFYQVPKEPREMNEKAYVPQFISIGPFHHGTQMNLIANERYKLQCFMNFLNRIDHKTNIESVKAVVDKVYLWVKEEAHSFYATPINMKEEEFVIMMILDACFIVEFFIIIYNNGYHGDHAVIHMQGTVDLSFYQAVHLKIFYDLIKLENQVPLFLLQSLFELIPTKDNDDNFTSITSKVLSMFGFVCTYKREVLENQQPKHLVDFLSSDFDQFSYYDRKIKEAKKHSHFFCHPLILRERLWWTPPTITEGLRERLWWTPPSITEVFKVGVTIKVTKNDKPLLKISFKNGVLKIPHLVIDAAFEVFIRNLIAFEQLRTRNHSKCVTQYALFLNSLISTDKDVDLLVNAGVIINRSDKQVSELFNNICKFASVTSVLQYIDISKALHLHCSRKWNHDKALLKRNYFNTPWATISLCAATLLLILTILQTIFSAISAFPSWPYSNPLPAYC